MSFINRNGQLLPASEVVFGPGNRSFRYGDGFFESMRLWEGASPLFSHHYKRLTESLATLKMQAGDNINENSLHAFLRETATANGHENGRARITFFREGAGLYTPERDNASFIIETAEMQEEPFSLNEKGLVTGIYREQTKSPGPLSNIKSNASLLFVMASLYCKEHQLDDCLLLNNSGNLVETSRSNIFLVKKGILYTPPASEGCITGVFRDYIIEKMKLSGSPVIEHPISPEFMAGCDELFTTSAARGIQWVEKCGPFCFTKGVSVALQRQTGALLFQQS